MSWKVKLGRLAEKQYKSLPDKMRAKIRQLFEVLETNPWPARMYDIRKLEGVGFEGYRVRVGRLRVVYAVLEDENVLYVLKIEKRGTVYKSFLF